MKDPLDDQIVLIALATTLIIVFSLIFSFRDSNKGIEPNLQWRDPSLNSSKMMQI